MQIANWLLSILSIFLFAGVISSTGGPSRRQPPTLFELDEFYTLGHFRLIQEALGRLRGYGVMFHLYVQTLAQLKVYGPDWETIVETCGIVQYFGGGPNMLTTKTLSEMLGTTTIMSSNSTISSAPGNQGSVSYSAASRALMMSDEVGRLPMPQQLLVRSGKEPTIAFLIHPSLRDFRDYQAFMFALVNGASIDVANAEAAWGATYKDEKPARPQKLKKIGFFSRLFA